MPSSPGYKRNYKQEAKTARKRGEGPARAANGRARYKKAKSLGVKPTSIKGDIAHKDNNAFNNSSSNLKVQSKAKNRSFSRTKKAGRKRK